MIKQIKKRDGSVVDFDKAKITGAIFKAARAAGGKDKETAERLANLVIEVLEKKLSKGAVPAVEEVQDMVEKVLIEEGHAKTAKGYILYRQQRALIRKEKAAVLEKEEIDEVDKRFDVNALRVLKSRYLRKDETGKLVETPKQLFTRIAVHVTIPELFYDQAVWSVKGGEPLHAEETFETAKNDGLFSIGKYKLNQYHLEALKRLYDRHNKNGNMKVYFGEFLKLLKNGYFNKYEPLADQFFDLMAYRKFLPNTPAIANFGAMLGMGSACFVLGIDDSMESIMKTLTDAAFIFKAGGGVGYNFSNLRCEGDFVKSTCGVASGPITFITLFDKMTEVIKQGGIRRGANMGILNSNHPDIEKFIAAKEGNKQLRNFNISVLVMGDFWKYYDANEPYPLVNPRDKKIVRYVNPRMLFDRIVYQAWESAEPGVIFYDKVNKFNPFFEHLGPIVTTNPCGEVLLYPNESCNLGSINVWAFSKEDDEGNIYFDWGELAEVTRTASRFLDNVIDVNKYPLKSIEDMTLATRKIGLGVMGVGDLLFELRLPYNAEDGRRFMEKLMEFINYHSKLESVELSKSRGPIPYYGKSFYPKGMMPFAGFEDKKSWSFDWDKVVEDVKKYGIRHGFTTVIAPTGSISMIAGTSSGIEPVYSLAFEKNVKVGSFYYTDPVFEKVMKREGLYDEKLMEEVVKYGGTVQNIPYIQPQLRKVFVTATTMTPEDHIRALAAFQKWTDSSISKTNNFPANATVEDMRASYILAYKLGCKDVTVFRDGSIKDQVLVAGEAKKSKGQPGTIEVKSTEPVFEEPIQVEATTGSSLGGTAAQTSFTQTMDASETLKNCPECSKGLAMKEGCMSCPECGWGLCK